MVSPGGGAHILQNDRLSVQYVAFYIHSRGLDEVVTRRILVDSTSTSLDAAKKLKQVKNAAYKWSESIFFPSEMSSFF